MNEVSKDMQIEFRAVLLAILDFLEHSETQRAVEYIKKALNSK